MNDPYDAIIVGSGAGGAAVAYKLVQGGKRVLVLEKGTPLPRDRSTLDVKQVFKEGRFKNHEPWVDGYNKVFIPGRVLQRRRQDEVVRRGAAALHPA